MKKILNFFKEVFTEEKISLTIPTKYVRYSLGFLAIVLIVILAINKLLIATAIVVGLVIIIALVVYSINMHKRIMALEGRGDKDLTKEKSDKDKVEEEESKVEPSDLDLKDDEKEKSKEDDSKDEKKFKKRIKEKTGGIVTIIKKIFIFLIIIVLLFVLVYVVSEFFLSDSSGTTIIDSAGSSNSLITPKSEEGVVPSFDKGAPMEEAKVPTGVQKSKRANIQFILDTECYVWAGYDWRKITNVNGYRTMYDGSQLSAQSQDDYFYYFSVDITKDIEVAGNMNVKADTRIVAIPKK